MPEWIPVSSWGTQNKLPTKGEIICNTAQVIWAIPPIPPNSTQFVFSDRWTMWEGGRTLNRLTQAPPLRSARIQRLSSRSWQHQTPSTKLTPFPHSLQSIISQTYPPPPYPQPYPTIATVSCKTCKHAIGWMCTKKWPTKTPVPESMWRQRYLNMFIDHFSQNLDKTNTENTSKKDDCMVTFEIMGSPKRFVL